jgi:flavin reductase
VPSSPTSRQFRDSVGMFATGITVLTARADGSGHGMTANAFASVSLDPLLVLVCVEQDAVMHKVLQEVGRFAVSVLAGDQEDLARYFSDPGRPKSMAQFLPVPWRPGPVTGAPLLDGALAWL